MARQVFLGRAGLFIGDNMVFDGRKLDKRRDPKRRFSKIYNHPDRNKIIRMLSVDGRGVRAVSNFLKEKYPDDKTKRLTTTTLQKFRREKLNLEGEALQAIKDASKERKIEQAEKDNEKDLERHEKKFQRLPVYKEKVKEAIELHVEIRRELSELLVLIKGRTEALFDKAAAGQITVNEEANLQRYFQAWTTAIERWAKYVERIADKTVETNVNITVIEDQMAVIREAIKETFQEVAPDLMPSFLDKLGSKMELLRYKHNTTSFGEIRDDTKILKESIEVMDEPA